MKNKIWLSFGLLLSCNLSHSTDYEELIQNIFSWDDYNKELNEGLAAQDTVVEKQQYLKDELQQLLNTSRDIYNKDDVIKKYFDIQKKYEDEVKKKQELEIKLVSVLDKDATREYFGIAEFVDDADYNEVVAEEDTIRIRFRTSRRAPVNWYIHDNNDFNDYTKNFKKSGISDGSTEHVITITGLDDLKQYYVVLAVQKFIGDNPQIIKYPSWSKLKVTTLRNYHKPNYKVTIENSKIKSRGINSLDFVVNAEYPSVFKAECIPTKDKKANTYSHNEGIRYKGNEINFRTLLSFKKSELIQCKNLKPGTEYKINVEGISEYGYEKFDSINGTTKENIEWDAGPLNLTLSILGPGFEWSVNKKPSDESKLIFVSGEKEFESDFKITKNETSGKYDLKSIIDFGKILNLIKSSTDSSPYVRAVVYDDDGNKLEHAFSLKMVVPSKDEMTTAGIENNIQDKILAAYEKHSEKIQKVIDDPKQIDKLRKGNWKEITGNILKIVLMFF